MDINAGVTGMDVITGTGTSTVTGTGTGTVSGTVSGIGTVAHAVESRFAS